MKSNRIKFVFGSPYIRGAQYSNGRLSRICLANLWINMFAMLFKTSIEIMFSKKYYGNEKFLLTGMKYAFGVVRDIYLGMEIVVMGIAGIIFLLALLSHFNKNRLGKLFLIMLCSFLTMIYFMH